MSMPRPLPKRLTTERVWLRQIYQDSDNVTYEVGNKGIRGTIGRVAVVLSGPVPIIEVLCIDEAARGYGVGSETARAVLRALAQRHTRVRA